MLFKDFLSRLKQLPEGYMEDVFDTLNAFCDGDIDQDRAEVEINEVFSRFETCEGGKIGAQPKRCRMADGSSTTRENVI